LAAALRLRKEEEHENSVASVVYGDFLLRKVGERRPTLNIQVEP
jgi:hypothetical protein